MPFQLISPDLPATVNPAPGPAAPMAQLLPAGAALTVPVAQLNLAGGGLAAGAAPTMLTSDRVMGPFPPIFATLPLVGEATWTRSLEEHPQATFNLVVTDQTIEAIRSAFLVGTELAFYGIGFRVESYQETCAHRNTQPGGFYTISVSLGGKWQPYLDKSIFLRPRPDGPFIGQEEPYQDPDCQLQPAPYTSVTTIILAGSVSINTLATRAEAVFQGPTLDVPMAPDTTYEETTTLGQALSDTVRPARCLAFYSQASAIVAHEIDQVQQWNYGELRGEFEQTIQSSFDPPLPFVAGGLNPPAIAPAAALPGAVVVPPVRPVQPENTLRIAKPQYKSVRVTGEFTEIADRRDAEEEDTNGNRDRNLPPRWRGRRPDVITLEQGDLNPGSPPVASTVEGLLNLNFDNSGPTKTVSSTTRQDGQTLQESTRSYGFKYHAIKTQQGAIAYSGGWGPIEGQQTQYNYQGGLLVGSNTSGFKVCRFKTQAEPTDESEAGGPKPEETFFSLPLLGRTQYVLAPYRAHYKDIDTSGMYVQYKRCNRDGSSSIEYIPDPTYQEPMFVAAEQTEKSCFATMPDPESTPEDPKPPLTTGEETYYRVTREIQSSSKTKRLGTPSFSNVADHYVEWIAEFSAQDPDYSGCYECNKFVEHEGRPPEASRFPPALERVEPEPDEGDEETQQTRRKFKYILTTPGHSPWGPEGGSVSYPGAFTLAQAVMGARVDLRLEDIQNSVQTTIDIPFNPTIKEGDLVTFVHAGVQYQRRVLSVESTLKFHGPLAGLPFVTSPGTKLTLGIERPEIEEDAAYAAIPLPQEPDSPEPPDDDPAPPAPGGILGFELGSLLPALRTRRNF